MRIARLLLVALLVLLAGRTAASQELATSHPNAKPDYLRPFSVKQDAPLPDGILRARPAAKKWFLIDDLPEGTEVCLTLHTLQVTRDAQHSDSTHLVSQRTCTPARQFEMKSAVVKK